MRLLMLSLTSVLLTACGGGEQAESDSDQRAQSVKPGQVLASACSGCHAIGGNAISDLSDWSADSIAASVIGYKADAEGTTVMHRLARGYSEGDIRRIAEFLAEEGEAR